MTEASKKRGSTILKWSILTVLLGYAAWVTVWAHAEASRDRCIGIDVRIAKATSADSITRRGVLDELKRYPEKIIGAQASTINTRRIRDFLSSFSNFESVECVMTPYGELRVNIVPMIPEIRVFSDAGSYYVNKDGKRIDSNAEFFVDVPIVRGNFTRQFPASSVLPLTRFIASDPMLRNLVAMVEAQDAHNLLLVPRIQGHVINFGDTSRLAEKRKMLQLAYHKIMPYKGWQTYDTISVKFRGQIVCTRRDKAMAEHGEQYEEDIDLEEATLPTAEPVGDASQEEQHGAVLASRPQEHFDSPAEAPEQPTKTKTTH